MNFLITGAAGFLGSALANHLAREGHQVRVLDDLSTGDPQALPAEQAFAMATIIGARALRLDSLIGSIENGKRADLIAIRIDAPHAVPMYNVYSQLVYALKASDVSDVMVNGKTIVRDRKMLTVEVGPVFVKAAEYQNQVAKSVKLN